MSSSESRRPRSYTYASSRDRGRRWTLSTVLASRPAFAPTVRRATERTLPVTTPRSCSTPAATTSRRSTVMSAIRDTWRRGTRLAPLVTFPNAGPGASPLLRLAHVFDVVWKPQPRMSQLLPDRPRRRREGRIGERAHRDGHDSRRGLRGVEHGRAAVRTEVEDTFLSTV